MRRASVLALVLPLLASFSCWVKNDKNIEKGQTAYQEHDYVMAVEHFSDALVGANDRSIVNFNLGTAYARRGEQAGDAITKQELFAIAIVTLREALTTRNPAHRLRVQFNLANVLVLARRYDEAVKAYEVVLQDNPTEHAAQQNLRIAEQLQRSELSRINKGKRQEDIGASRMDTQPIRATQHSISGPKQKATRVVLEKLRALERGVVPWERIPASSPSGLLSIPGYVAPTGTHEDVFLYAVCDKRSAWLGEQITVSWLVFAPVQLFKYEPTPPGLAGWWSETLFEPRGGFTYSNVMIDGIPYVAALVSQRALFATEPGQRRVEALRATIAVSDTRAKSLVSNDLHVQIKELPKPAPKGFDPRYVGEFRIRATVEQTHMRVGETPARYNGLMILRLAIEGEGAIARTRAPQLPHPSISLTASKHFEEARHIREHQVGGRHVYEYRVDPQAAHALRIPAIELPFFRPATGRYEVVMSQAIDLSVGGVFRQKNTE